MFRAVLVRTAENFQQSLSSLYIGVDGLLKSTARTRSGDSRSCPVTVFFKR